MLLNESGNIVVMPVDDGRVAPHELITVTETRPLCLVCATLADADGRKALLYNCEGLVPVALYGDRRNDMTLSALFAVLTGYIRALLYARDFLLDTALLSSDPEKGVFVRGGRAQGEMPVVKAIWGMDAVSAEGEKICRIAASLAGRTRVMGAQASMARMIEIVQAENPSLRDCLKTAESLCREWNGISGQPQTGRMY